VKSTVTATTATPDTSFRLYLQSELARRCTRNAQYSLRAFALHLGVDHSTLSQWLRGRRPMTSRSIESVGEALGLSRTAVRAYVESAQREHDDGPFRLSSVLTGETLEAIREWYHVALLELTRLREFRTDSRWIARVLDISVDEVNVALQRLIRLDLLEMEATDRWVDKSGDASTSLEQLAHTTIEARLTATGRLSSAACRHVPTAYRDHTSITMAIDSAALPRAFELVSRFRQQLVDLLGGGDADDVYQIDIALFPVTTLKHERTGASWDVR
jgi:transcriptional regulator with XRE-family HTH domain